MNTRKVALFAPCLVDSLYPEVAEDLVTVLRKVHATVSYPEGQTCCGQPAFNSGYRKEAAGAAKHFLDVFRGSDTIVCPSGSCVKMVRTNYLDLLQGEGSWAERAKETAARTFEFSEYLVDVLKVEDVGASFSGKVTYHDSCSLLRGLGIRDQPRQLIKNVKGLEFVELEDSDRCCGFGGSFAFKYADISAAMLKDKVSKIIASGVEAVVGCDIGCLMNIQGLLSRNGAEVRTIHLAQLLAM